MNVLFWVDKFPTYSETFIRDQIVALINIGNDVYIYSENGINFLEIESLKGFETYNLKNKIINDSSLINKSKRKRGYLAFKILIHSIFTKKFNYYLKTLNKSKYGYQSKSLKLFFLVHFLLKNKIEIIHAHFGTNGLTASKFKEIGLPLKLFTTFHGYDIRLGQTQNKNFYSELFKHANGIISISNYNRINLMAFGVKKKQLIDLSNGVDVNYFKKENKSISSTNIKILTVARLVDDKALDIALKSLALIINNNPNLNFNYLIIGDGILFEELKSLAIQLNIDKHVTFYGKGNSSEVKVAMVTSDLFLLSSKNEALPTVLLEAQSCELPVLATNVGSVKDIVKAGLVVAPNNIESFSKGLQKMIDNRSNWSKMGKDGRDYVVKNHDIFKKTKELLELYKNY